MVGVVQGDCVTVIVADNEFGRRSQCGNTISYF